MDQSLHALAGILLKSIPTIVIVLLLHFYLKKMLFGPLQRVLAERDAATTGARKAAEEALDQAERRAAEYEAAIRDARSEIYKEQEHTRAELISDQDARLKETRARVDAMIEEAKTRIQAEAEVARKSLADSAGVLADQIADSVLTRRVS